MRATVMAMAMLLAAAVPAAAADAAAGAPPNAEEGPPPNWPVGHFQIVETRLGDTEIPVLLNTVNGAMWVMVNAGPQKGVVWVPMTINSASTPVTLSPAGPSSQ